MKPEIKNIVVVAFLLGLQAAVPSHAASGPEAAVYRLAEVLKAYDDQVLGSFSQRKLEPIVYQELKGSVCFVPHGWIEHKMPRKAWYVSFDADDLSKAGLSFSRRRGGGAKAAAVGSLSFEDLFAAAADHVIAERRQRALQESLNGFCRVTGACPEVALSGTAPGTRGFNPPLFDRGPKRAGGSHSIGVIDGEGEVYDHVDEGVAADYASGDEWAGWGYSPCDGHPSCVP